MRVLIYGINYAPENTGTGKYNTEMAEWLAEQGHNVDVITAYPHYPKWCIMGDYNQNGFSKENINGIRVFRSPLWTPRDGKINTKGRILLETTFSISSLKWWLPIIFNKKLYDVAIAVCPPMQIAMLPWFYRVVRKVPWVYHIQDLQVDAAFKLGMIGNKALLKKLLYKIENFFLTRATRVSTISSAMKYRIMEKGVKDKSVLLFPNWSDIDFVRPLPRINAIRSQMGIDSEQILILYSGNMGKKQGLELLLDVALKFKDRTNIKFALVGDGAERDNLQQHANSKALQNVLFLDFFPWEQVPELLATGDIHAVIQNAEAADLVMPSKLTNILAAGRPCIVTAEHDTELYENISGAQAGIVVMPNNAEAFAEALEKLIDDKILREKMGYNARQYAEKYLAKEEILGNFEKQLLNIANH